MAEMTKRKGSDWLARIDDAQKLRNEKIIQNIKRHLALYRGEHWGRKSYFQKDDLITVNLVFPMIRNQIPNYYYKDPKFFVKPRNEESEIPAYLCEEILNYYWKEIAARREVRFCLYDVLLASYAVMEVGWRFETDVIKKSDGERISYHEYVKTDRPYLRRVSPLRFLFDKNSDYDPIVNSEWVAKEVFRNVHDVKKDPRYKNTQSLEASIKTSASNYRDSYIERYGEDVIKLIEVHDRKYRRLYTFAEGYERPLLDVEHPYDEILEGHNFVWLQFNHIPDEPYGISQVALLEDQQHELNRTRTQMFHHRRRVSNRRYIYDEGTVSDRSLQKLEEAEGGALVPVASIDRIKPLEDARLSFDVPMIESVIKQDIRELTGLPASQFGVIDTKSRSATEHIQIEAARQQRSNDNLILVEEWLRDTGRKLLQVIQAKTDRKQVIQIVGPKGSFWQEWTKEDIQGEYMTDLDPGSTLPQSDELRRKQALDMFSLFAKVPGFNLRELAGEVFKSYGFSRNERFFAPNFDQMYGLGSPTPAIEGQGEGVAVDGRQNQSGVPTEANLLANARQTGPT